MKLIHTADLHLDSELSAHLDKERAKMRRAEILDTFRRMVSWAEENGVRLYKDSGPNGWVFKNVPTGSTYVEHVSGVRITGGAAKWMPTSDSPRFAII